MTDGDADEARRTVPRSEADRSAKRGEYVGSPFVERNVRRGDLKHQLILTTSHSITHDGFDCLEFAMIAEFAFSPCKTP